tara:strand:- start:185 stop:1174 length:990 start_codon:yes stop_codon:yes gene_type:complete
LSAQIKIHIYTEFKDGPWGGGNQCLKALRNEFIRRNCYTENPEEADVILFNSHHYLKDIVRLRRKFQDKIFVHRVDGPMSYRGGEGEKTDRKIFKINRMVADGTVFQSGWSRSESRKQGMKTNRFERVIHNAPDPDIFHPARNGQKISSDKIKLIASSWSNNPDKGFDIYHFLDENLDFERFEMTFVGQIDKPFINLKTLDPMPSFELAELLRKHDIFVFASKREACSNSLVEALSCGLPAVARNSSSNPEVLGESGGVFDGKKDVVQAIGTVAENLNDYRKNLNVPTIKVVAEEYYQFFENIILAANKVTFSSKTLNFSDSLILRFTL